MNKTKINEDYIKYMYMIDDCVIQEHRKCLPRLFWYNLEIFVHRQRNDHNTLTFFFRKKHRNF